MTGWRPPKIGRSNYDRFRAEEKTVVLQEAVSLVDNTRIHEKAPGGRGRPPAKKRDLIKCLLFLILFRVTVQDSPSILPTYKDTLGVEKIPAPRTIYKYRALPELTPILERLQWLSAKEEWMKETMAAADSTGYSHSKGKHWVYDRLNPKKYREFDKAHCIVGVNSLVIPKTIVTRGSWSDKPEFRRLVEETIPDSNIRVVTADAGYVSNENFELAHEAGVTAYIEPKDNAVFRPHPTNGYERSVYFATRFPKRWKEAYRWRVKVECAFNSKKAMFGDVIRGKNATSRRNQAILRDILHNLRSTMRERYGA